MYDINTIRPLDDLTLVEKTTLYVLALNANKDGTITTPQWAIELEVFLILREHLAVHPRHWHTRDAKLLDRLDDHVEELAAHIAKEVPSD